MALFFFLVKNATLFSGESLYYPLFFREIDQDLDKNQKVWFSGYLDRFSRFLHKIQNIAWIVYDRACKRCFMASKEFIAKMKKQLEQEKTRLESELSAFAHRNANSKDGDFETDFPNLGDKEDENASEVAEFSNNLSLEDELEKALRDVQNAISAIEEGKYGVCKYCSQDIDERRLVARPTSSSCIQCKKTLTQEV